MQVINIPEGLQSKLCILGENVLPEVPNAVKKLWPDKEVILIADENTWDAAGKEVSRLLAESGIALAQPKVFPRTIIMLARLFLL